MIINKEKIKKLIPYFVAIIIIALTILGYFYLPGRAKVNLNISNARITIDHKEISAGKSIWLKQGKHTVSADKNGYMSTEITIDIKCLSMTPVNLTLYKITSLSSDNEIDQISNEKVESQNARYLFVDEEGKSVMKLENSQTSKVMDLPFLANETTTKIKWSDDQGKLFIQTLSGDNYINRIISIDSGTTDTLSGEVLDVAFDKDIYYTLEKSGDSSIIKFKGEQKTSLNQIKNNLEISGNTFILYNDISDENPREMFLCQSGASDCQKRELPADIYKIYTSGDKILAILVGSSYELYDLSGSQNKLIAQNIMPVLSSQNNAVYYLSQGENCSIVKYDFANSATIYQNNNICDINDFSVSSDGKKLFFSQGLSAYLINLE